MSNPELNDIERYLVKILSPDERVSEGLEIVPGIAVSGTKKVMRLRDPVESGWDLVEVPIDSDEQ